MYDDEEFFDYRVSALPKNDVYAIRIADWFVMAGANVDYSEEDDERVPIALTFLDGIYLVNEPQCGWLDHDAIAVDDDYVQVNDHIIQLSGMLALGHSLPPELVEKLMDPIREKLSHIGSGHDYEIELGEDKETHRHWVWLDRNFTADDLDPECFEQTMQEFMIVVAEVEDSIF